MLLLNKILENITYNVGYIINIYIRHQKWYRFTKDANINVGNINWIVFWKLCFPSEDLTFNVVYYLHFLLIQ